jgi:hypothetical protein
MKSNKQRRAEIKIHRAKRASKKTEALTKREEPLPHGSSACDPNALAPYNSYGMPLFVERGYYVDIEFQCRDCQKQEIWTAAQQKWWYEVAKGNVESRASRCRACRKIERERKAEARRVHLEGLKCKL